MISPTNQTINDLRQSQITIKAQMTMTQNQIKKMKYEQRDNLKRGPLGSRTHEREDFNQHYIHKKYEKYKKKMK